MNETQKMLYDTVINAPEFHIDKYIKNKLVASSHKINYTGLKSILDDCAKYSLASDFMMYTLNIVLLKMKNEQEIL